MPHDRTIDPFAGHHFALLLTAQLLLLVVTAILYDAGRAVDPRIHAAAGFVAFTLVIAAGTLVITRVRGGWWHIVAAAIIVGASACMARSVPASRRTRR